MCVEVAAAVGNSATGVSVGAREVAEGRGMLVGAGVGDVSRVTNGAPVSVGATGEFSPQAVPSTAIMNHPKITKTAFGFAVTFSLP